MDKITCPEVRKRTKIVISVLVILFMVLVARLYQIQIINGEQYQKDALSSQMTSAMISAERGNIYDRNMNTLAQSEQVYDICISPMEIKNENINELTDIFSKMLDVEPERIKKACENKKSQYFVVKYKVPKLKAEEVLNYSREKKIKGVFLQENTRRFYPYGSLASTVLGFTNSENDGAYGLEAYYNKTLRGKKGRIITATNAAGTYMPYNYKQIYEAEEGNSLVLTIDESIQHFAEKHLEEAVKEYDVRNRASCIVMDVKTGEILAMANKPDFDPNEPYEIGDSRIKAELEELKGKDEELYNEKKKEAWYAQWRNKAVSDPYEPGSVFKTITAAAALDLHIVDPYSERFSCPGYYVVGNKRVGCWKTSGHGNITFSQAIKYSCNPVFMQMGQRLGGENFYNYFEAFGLTKPTGIDMPGEADNAGLVHYKKALSVDGSVELPISAFGQTFKITPIQLATAISAVVNGGYLMEPHIVKQEIDIHGNVVSTTEPKVKRQVISEETSKLMRELLEGVVSDQVGGSGRSVYMPGYRIGGKTGTSEKTDKRIDGKVAYWVSSFMGFAPVDDPQIMVLVLLDEPANGNVFGSVVASPVVGGILADTLPYLGIQPNYTEEEMQTMDISVPYVTGRTVLEAENKLNREGLKHKVIGKGKTVVKQVPSSGQPIPRNGEVILYTTENEDVSTTVIPNIIGYSGQQANKTLINQGLNVRFTGVSINAPGCVVAKIDPPPGTEVERGSVVTLEFTDRDLAG